MYLFNNTDYILKIHIHGLTFKYYPSQFRRIIVARIKGIIYASTQHVHVCGVGWGGGGCTIFLFLNFVSL